MKKFILAFFIICLCSGSLFAEKVVGVTAFQNLTKNPKLKWMEIGIADSISLKLRNVPEFIVIDRTNVDKVINEIQFGQSGLIDDKTAKKAGKALNADILVVGNFQVYGNRVRITAKIVEVESHKILKQVQSTGIMDSIFDLQDDIALKIIDEKNIQVTKDIKERITEKYTSNLTAYEFYSKGQKFYYNASYDKAIELFNKAVNVDSRYSLAYAGLGKAYANQYWKLKNYANTYNPELLDKSYEYTKKALKYSPNLDEAHLSLAKYYQNVDKKKVPDKWKKCEEITKKVIELNPNNGEAYFLMSRIYGYNDAKEEEYIKKALSKNSFLVDGYNNLGIIYTSQKKYDLAEEQFKKAIEIDPEYKTAYMNVGVVYDRQGKLQKALDMYKIVVEKYPNYPLGLVNVGIGYRRLNKYDEALPYFKKAVKIKPDYPFGWGEVAYIYLKKKDYKKAIKYYKESLKYDPKYKFSLANLGYSYEKLGKYNTAIMYLKRAVRYHPKYAWPMGELGYIYRYKLKNNKLALQWYTKALINNPTSTLYQRQVRELSNIQ